MAHKLAYWLRSKFRDVVDELWKFFAVAPPIEFDNQTNQHSGLQD